MSNLLARFSGNGEREEVMEPLHTPSHRFKNKVILRVSCLTY